jgi:hypothetical protein
MDERRGKWGISTEAPSNYLSNKINLASLKLSSSRYDRFGGRCSGCQKIMIF